jgi:hypothetical protein
VLAKLLNSKSFLKLEIITLNREDPFSVLGCVSGGGSGLIFVGSGFIVQAWVFAG